MRKWAKSAGLLFCAAASVYNGPAAYAGGESQLKQSDSSSLVKLISDTPGAPDTAPSTQPTVSVTNAGTISIHTNSDSKLVDILRIIADQSQPQLSIIPSKEVRGTVPAMDLNNVSVFEALDAILHTNDMDWKQKGNVIYVYTQKEVADQEKAARRSEMRIFHLHYITAVDAANLIKPALSPEAVISITPPAKSGINQNTTEAGGNSQAYDDMIVVNDYPENLEQISKIIKEIDHRPQQILIEATIFEANLNENNAMGIDFSLMGGVNFDQLISNGTPLTSALSGNILNVSGTGATGGTSSTPANLVKQGYAGATSGNYDTKVPAGGLQIGVVKNNLGVFISALEAVTDATILANPKVLALDKQRGEVIVGSQFGYLTTTTTSTTSTQTIDFLTTGTNLLFRPFISDDGYIRMEIHPEESTGGLNAANLPVKNTTEITSNVMIKDGNTIVIGGLFHESSSTNRSQVPFFGDLPLIGPLFRSKADATQRQEIIILLTPHIIKDDAEYSKASEAELKDAETLRVGVRKGMMWFGRERLAESAYEDAVTQMNKPHPNTELVLWYLNCAINLNPKFIEAIQMKEKLTGKRVTDVDNATIRAFVRQQIIADTAPPTTMPSAAAAEMSAVMRPLASAPATRPSISEIPAIRPSTDAAMIDEDEEAASAANP